MRKIQILSVMTALVFLCSCFGYRSIAQTTNQFPKSDRQVVILSLDGFRRSYLDVAKTPNIDSIASVGFLGFLQPSYPSLTFPNHYSMATGLYPNSHGIVTNMFFDKKLGRYKLGDRKSVENPAFYGGEPVWNTAERQGVRAASFFWVGSETNVNGHQPWSWKKYDSKVPYYDRADTVIKWLSMPKSERPRLIMWYIEEPDHFDHLYTPESPKTIAKVEQMDSVVGYFLNKLRQLPNRDNVDFILVSDHGMAAYTPEQSVDLSEYLDRNDFDHIVDGVPSMLYPKKGKLKKVLNDLKKVPNVTFYRKGDIPKRFHFGSNPRIGEIVVMPNIGTYLYFREGKAKKIVGGAHGYDNAAPEMKALFAGFGPDFKQDIRFSSPIPNITIYPLLCRLLSIEPAKNDASEKDVDKVINGEE